MSNGGIATAVILAVVAVSMFACGWMSARRSELSKATLKLMAQTVELQNKTAEFNALIERNRRG